MLNFKHLRLTPTWEVVPCPLFEKSIRSKWVYSIKLQSDGSLKRYKACFVALSNHQEYDIDYEETFASMAEMMTV